MWATAYGLVLLGKVAYNHFRFLPTLRHSGGADAAMHLRRVGLGKLALLTVVAGLTSPLVGLAG